jgi:hypothetical protein
LNCLEAGKINQDGYQRCRTAGGATQEHCPTAKRIIGEAVWEICCTGASPIPQIFFGAQRQAASRRLKNNNKERFE